MQHRFKSLVVLLACLGVSLGAGPTTQRSEAVAFKPGGRGRPDARIGGGSRGPDEKLPLLFTIVPKETACTTREQPVLVWFVSKPTKVRCEIAINDKETKDTVYETTLDGIPAAGFQYLDLSKTTAKLKTGVEYEWLVALVPDPAARSKDAMTGTSLLRIAPPETLAGKLNTASDVDKAAAYLSEGIWIDGLAELNAAIAAKPDDAALKEQRASLLTQVGLKEAAEFAGKK